MPVQRTAQVARTAHDKTHLNRLGVPEFGVVEIQVKGQGGSLSKSYRDASSVTAKAPSGTGSDAFHFAPGPQYAAATWASDANLKDDVKIVYTLHNPQYAIKTAKLEIFRRFTKHSVWSRDLKEDELLHGETTLKFNNNEEWDGKIGNLPEFEGEFLTAEHSPYKFKLTITGDGVNQSPCAWTYVHVMIGKLELEYGPDEALPVQPANMEGGVHRDTFTDLKTQGTNPPATGTTPPLKVNIQSDIFKTSSDDMFKNQLYERFKTLWDNGPQIPIFCKIWLKSSSDTDVVAPKAIGKLKFLWDWESKSTAAPTAFAAAAENYLVSKTGPKGRNCHYDRGGKRGEKGDPVFPKSAGYDPAGAWTNGTFPFIVERTKKRKWASYSYAWNDGIGGSKTGLIFQPARMAGDTYEITVYVDQIYDRKENYSLNVTTDAPLTVPDVIKAATGQYQVWRQVNVRKYVKKNGSVAETINLTTVHNEYAKAYLDLNDRTAGTIVPVTSGDWTSRLNTTVGGFGNNIVRMKNPGNQYTLGGGGIYLRTRDAYRQAYMEEVGTGLDGLGLGGMTPALRGAIVTAAGTNRNSKPNFTNAVTAALTTHGGGLSGPEQTQVKNTARAHWTTVDNYMTDPSNKMDTDANYLKLADGLGRQVVSDCFSPEADANSGCTIFHCDKLHDLGSSLLGWAYDVPGGAGNRCGFLLCATNADHSAGDNIENTATHEFGHHFFLPHTPDAGEKKNYKAHDKSVNTCIMSYNVPTEFCGFCQLRLRGWSKNALKPKSSSNTKT